jgi:hypothetical protein
MLNTLKKYEVDKMGIVSPTGNLEQRARFTKNWPNRSFLKSHVNVDKETLQAPQVRDLSFHIPHNLLEFKGPQYTKVEFLVNYSSEPIDFILQTAPHNFFSAFPPFGSLQPRGSIKIFITFKPRLQSWGSDGKEIRGYLRIRSLSGFPMERIELRAYNGPLMKIQSPSINFGFCALGESFDLPIFAKGVGHIPTECVIEIHGPAKKMFTISPMQATVHPGKTHEFIVTFSPHRIAGDDPDIEEENIIEMNLPKSKVFIAYLHFFGQGGESHIVQLNGIEGQPLKVDESTINFNFISDRVTAENTRNNHFHGSPEVSQQIFRTQKIVLENLDPFYSLPVFCSSSDEQLTWSEESVVLPPSSSMELAVTFSPNTQVVNGGKYFAYLSINAPKCDPVNVKVTAFVGDFLTFGSSPIIYLPPFVPSSLSHSADCVTIAAKVAIPLFNHSSFDMKVYIDGLTESISGGNLSLVIHGEGNKMSSVTGQAMDNIGGAHEPALFEIKANTQAQVELWYHGANSGYFERDFWVEIKTPFVARYGPWTIKSATIQGEEIMKKRRGVPNIASKREMRSTLSAITEDVGNLPNALVGAKAEDGLAELRSLLSVPVFCHHDRRGTKGEVFRRRSRRFSLEGAGASKPEKRSMVEAIAGLEKGTVSVVPAASVLLLFDDPAFTKASTSRHKREASTSFIIHNGHSTTTVKYELFVSKPLVADVPLCATISPMQTLKVTLTLKREKKVRAGGPMEIGFVTILDEQRNAIKTFQVHAYSSNAVDIHLESEHKATYRSYFFSHLLDLVNFGEIVVGSKQRKRLRVSNQTMYSVSLTMKMFAESPNMSNNIDDDSPKVFTFEDNNALQLPVNLDPWQQFEVCLIFHSTIVGKFQWILQVEHQITADSAIVPEDTALNVSYKCLRGISCAQSNLQIEPHYLDFGNVPLRSHNEKEFSVVNYGSTVASTCMMVPHNFSITPCFATIPPQNNSINENRHCEGHFETKFIPPTQGSFGETVKIFHGDKPYIVSLVGCSGIVELTSNRGSPYSEYDKNIINLGIVNTLESEQISLVVTNVGSLAAVIDGISCTCAEISCNIIPETNILKAPSSMAKITEQEKNLITRSYDHGDVPKDAIEMLGDSEGNLQKIVLDWDEIAYQHMKKSIKKLALASDDTLTNAEQQSNFPITIRPGHSVTIFLTLSLRTVCKKTFDVILKHHPCNSIQSILFRMSGTFQPTLSWEKEKLDFGTIPSKSTKRLKAEFLNEGLAGVSLYFLNNKKEKQKLILYMFCIIGIVEYRNVK